MQGARSKSSFSIALIGFTSRRIPASASANQGPETGDLVLLSRQLAGADHGAGCPALGEFKFLPFDVILTLVVTRQKSTLGLRGVQSGGNWSRSCPCKHHQKSKSCLGDQTNAKKLLSPAGSWQARITVQGALRFLGSFASSHLAAVSHPKPYTLHPTPSHTHFVSLSLSLSLSLSFSLSLVISLLHTHTVERLR